MINWFHKWLNPHCAHCREEKLCSSCDILKMQLAIVREENKKLLDTILDFTKPKVEEAPVREVSNFEPTIRSWKQKQRLLEEEDRVRAKIIADMERELDLARPDTKDTGKETGANVVSDSKTA